MTTEGPYYHGVNDALAGRPLNNTYGDNEDGKAYVEGYNSRKVDNSDDFADINPDLEKEDWQLETAPNVYTEHGVYVNDLFWPNNDSYHC